MAGLSIGYKVHNPYVVAAVATVGGMLFGFDISSVSAFQGQKYYQDFFFDCGENCDHGLRQSGITSAMPGGSFLACFFAGVLSDKFGRKFVIQVASFIWMVGAAIQSSSQNLTQLIFGRVIAGAAIGLASAQVPVYIAEISPKNIRGRLVGAFQWAVTWGILIMFYISYGCSKIEGNGSWRLAWGIQIIPGLLLFIGTLILEESPRWLAARDRWDEAIDIVAKIQAHGDRNADHVRIEIEEIKEAVRLEHNARVGIIEMFSGSVNLRRTMTGLWCQIWQQLTGMNVMMYYVVKVFTMAGYSDSANTTLVASSIQYVINVVMTVPALLFIDSWGRRPLLIIGAILLMAWLFAQVGLFATYGIPTGPEGYVAPATEANPNPTPDDSVKIRINHQPASRAVIAVSYLFVATFAPTWGPAGWIYCSEIFPLEQRATGNALCAAANWAFNFAIGMFTLPGFQHITYKTYCIYASCCFAMAIHVFLMFPETKGRTLEEVDMLWKSGVPAWKSHLWQPEYRANIEDINAANGGRAPSLKGGADARHEEDINSSAASLTEEKV